jgi:TetR/AcrR family tetracycline transcriptional repressor
MTSSRAALRARRRTTGRTGSVVGKRQGVPLNRERVVAEALAMLDRDGVGRFSLRRLADHLGVTPMAVYNHVNGKQDLLQAVADAVVGSVEYHPAHGNWQKAIAACFRTLRRTCLAHPGAVPVIESAEILPNSIFRPMEITLEALRGAGLSVKASSRAYFLLTTFTMGQVKYQTSGWARGLDAATAVGDGRITPSAFPSVVRAKLDQPWDFDAAFEFGLSVILAGLAAKGARSYTGAMQPVRSVCATTSNGCPRDG